jgi:hypothetical protein
VEEQTFPHPNADKKCVEVDKNGSGLYNVPIHQNVLKA